MKSASVVKNYFVLPCCLLLLNLVNTIISYKVAVIYDGFLRAGFIIFMVLVGSLFVTYAVTPAIESLVRWLHTSTKQRAGGFGEVIFLLLLGIVVFWLYYRAYIIGPQAILPAAWRNHHG